MNKTIQLDRNIAESAPYLLSIVDEQYRYISVNQRYLDIFKTERKQTLGRHVSEIVGDEHFEAVERPNIDRALRGQTVFVQHWTEQLGAEKVCLHVRYSPYWDESGAIRGALVAGHDITEIKKAEDSLQRYEQIVNSVSDYMAFISPDYRYLALNRQFLEAFDLDREHAIGRKVADVIGKENFEKISKPNVDKALEGEHATIHAWSYQNAYGNRYLELNYVPYRNNDGEIAGVIVVSHDITRYKEAEEELRLYEHIVNASTDYIAIVDKRYRYLAVNQHYLDAFGQTRQDAIGKHMESIVGRDNFEKISKPNLARCMEGEAVEYQGWSYQPVFGKVYLQLKYVPYKDRDGNIIGAIVTAHDITSLKQAQDSLQKSEKQLREAQRLAQLGSWEWDLVEDKLYWSDECYSLLGLNAENFQPRNRAVLEMVHPDDRERLRAAIEKAIHAKGRLVSTHRVVLPSGDIRYHRVLAEVTQDEADKPVRMLGTVMDITDMKQVENELEQHRNHLEQLVENRTVELQKTNASLEKSIDELKAAQGQLIQSEKMASLGGLVAGVAHEINTPIGMCVTAASYLLDKLEHYSQLYENDSLTRAEFEELLDTSKESASILFSNINRAAELIRGFKQVAVDQTSGEIRCFFLKEYIQEVLQSLKPEYKHSEHVVSLDCPEDIHVYTHPGAISQIITNLLMNSLIHGFEGKEKGQIEIAVQKKQDNIEIIYTDNGKGISQESVRKIFEPFYTTKRGQGGSGLGMHIVFNLVNQTLHGRITCESEVGHGTTFKILIPETLEDNGQQLARSAM